MCKKIFANFLARPIYGMHSNLYNVALNTLLGSWDRPEIMLRLNKKGNKHGHVDTTKKARISLKRSRFDELEKYPLGYKLGVYCKLFENLAKKKGPISLK